MIGASPHMAYERVHDAADNDWDKESSSPENSAQNKVSPNVPRPASRSGSATSLRSGKAAGPAAAQAGDGPNGGGWAGWDAEVTPAAATNAKKDDADDWGKW